jgi:hypothetical protein
MAQKRKNAPGKGRKGQPHSLKAVAVQLESTGSRGIVAGPPRPDGSPNVAFGTTTAGCCVFASGWAVTTVAMESTGVLIPCLRS